MDWRLEHIAVLSTVIHEHSDSAIEYIMRIKKSLFLASSSKPLMLIIVQEQKTD